MNPRWGPNPSVGLRPARRRGYDPELVLDDAIAISEASDSEREWCARLMAGSDPWITLGRGLEACLALCRHSEYRLMVAHSAGEPCGFVLLDPRGVAGSPYLASIAVAEKFRGRGIGSRLLTFTEECFPEARHLFLCVSSFNGNARRLYERHGYRVAGELEDYVIEGASELLMHKRLVKR